MQIIQSILTQNDCYKSGRKITPKGLMIHSVGCPQPSASVFIKQWNKSGVGKCVHAFIEADGDVYQTLPNNIRGWHCASGKNGSGNDMYLGFEMCEPSTIKYIGATWNDLNPEATKKHVLGTYNTAVEFFASLCKELNLDPLGQNVIISHSEGNKLGIASGHIDVEHIWQRMGLTMEQFRKDIAEAMKPKVKPKDYKTAIESIQYLASKGRLSSPQEWIDNLPKMNNLEFVFQKWANDVKKLEGDSD